jgi:hypothetical protein
MKTIVPSTKMIFALALTLSVLGNTLFAQSGPGGGPGSGQALLRNGLSFKNPRLLTSSSTNLKQGAIYLFEDVFTGVDAKLSIDTLVNGATIVKIDDNSGGLGYEDALQPEIKSGNVIGKSYAVFTIRFFEANTNTPETLQSVNATALDIDGNLTLKEFTELRMGNGGTASFMGTSLDLSLLNLLSGKFIGENLLGIERSGIDTSAFSNMFTASNTGISSFTVKYGTTALLPTGANRQFSLYMKGFTYPDQITLPVELTSFSAVLNGNKADLRWTTATERNVSHFVVERSLDGKNYEDAGLVFAYGNTTETMNYSFSDAKINTAKAGMIYYRLRSVDIDTKSQFSAVRMIRIAKQNDQTIAVLTYPNPVTNELRVTVPGNWQGKKVSYEVLNNNGRLSIRTESGSSSQTETINVSNLTAGVYLVKVTCNGETALQKIVKH